MIVNGRPVHRLRIGFIGDEDTFATLNNKYEKGSGLMSDIFMKFFRSWIESKGIKLGWSNKSNLE